MDRVDVAPEMEKDRSLATLLHWVLRMETKGVDAVGGRK